MPMKVRSSLTYANVVSTLCLFILLGGSAYAAIKVTGKNVKDSSLTGKDIKNSSLGAADVKNGSLLAGDFKSGQLPAGPQGPRGASGLQGPKGDPGAPATWLWAQVTATGELAANSGAVSAGRGVHTGTYRVYFNRPVKACASIVTAGNVTTGPYRSKPMIADTTAEGAFVEVELVSTNGTGTNNSFHLAVFC